MIVMAWLARHRKVIEKARYTREWFGSGRYPLFEGKLKETQHRLKYQPSGLDPSMGQSGLAFRPRQAYHTPRGMRTAKGPLRRLGLAPTVTAHLDRTDKRQLRRL